MDERSRVQLRWRQALLFVVAMLVPCTVLVMLGMRTIQQERQLEDDRLARARQAQVDRLRVQLLAELDALALQLLQQVVAHGGRIGLPPREPVAFVGALRGGELLLPWQAGQVLRRGASHGGLIVFRRSVRSTDDGLQARLVTAVWTRARAWDWPNRVVYLPTEI